MNPVTIAVAIELPFLNTLIVDDATRLVLSQLYQLRGRVGRSDRIAYAYLFYDEDKKLTKLKDGDGKIINFETNDDNWIIYERANYDKEESFWVYGYHPVYQRKDFNWIYENLIANNVDKFNIKQILVYRNKLLISTTYELNMVLCKNESDCIRLYNELEKEKIAKKLKYVFFNGDAYHSKLKKTWFKKIQDLTGWDTLKIRRKSLRP